MNERTPDQLERALTAMTDSAPSEPIVLRRVLDRENERTPRRGHRRKLIGGGVITGLLLIGFAGVWMGSSVERPVSYSVTSSSRQMSPDGTLYSTAPVEETPSFYASDASEFNVPGRRAHRYEGSPSTDYTSPILEDRAVIRTGQISITTEDVQGACDEVRRLVRPELGEYIGDVRVALDEARTRGELVLKVRPERLESLIDEVGELGEVVDIRLTGRDVSDQLVDLEARIRNERQTEEELRELLGSRAASEARDVLGDILKVRQELGRVREQIERMEAQREQLRAMTALASLEVSVEGVQDEREEESDKPGVLDRFGEAAQSGLGMLVDSVAWLIEGLVGGLVWWAPLALGAILLYPRVRWWLTWA